MFGVNHLNSVGSIKKSIKKKWKLIEKDEKEIKKCMKMQQDAVKSGGMIVI